jgi:hypothetical protein
VTDELDPLAAKIKASLRGTDPEKLKALVRGHREIEEIKKNLGPQTKDELWNAFKEKYGMELVREAVCPGHSSQLDFVWQVYNFVSLLGVFSRGYGKTSLMGLTDALQCDFYPGFTSFTIGPGKDQGERKYEHILPFVVEGGSVGGKELDHIQRSIQTKTEWKNKSKMEIALGGGIDNANGPRSNRLHRDEIELMLKATRDQAANIPAGKATRDGRYVPAHTVDTSTMKWANGYVDQEMQKYYKKLRDAEVDVMTIDPIDAFHLAVERGHRPKKLMLVSCIYEVAAENPTCRSVPDVERRARLIKLERDPDEICDCFTYSSDVWETDDPDMPTRPRTLEDACQGRFFRSRGYQQFGDIKEAFMENDKATWEAEKECSEPSREGSYIKSYSQDRHGIKGYEPDPENGKIYTSTDWGADDEHWTGWFQVLDRPVKVASYKGYKVKTMPTGSVVAFAEFFKAQIGNVEHGNVVKQMENEWFLKWPGWSVFERYYDNANRGAMLDWRDQCGLILVNRIKKDFGEELKMVRTMIGGWTYYVDIPACPALDASHRGWRQVNGREVRNEHTHAAAGTRYFAHNRHVVERALARSGSRPPARPGAAEDEQDRPVEREAELERGIKVVRHGSSTRTREVAGVAGAEDSPLRAGSDKLSSPDFRIMDERER